MIKSGHPRQSCHLFNTYIQSQTQASNFTNYWRTKDIPRIGYSNWKPKIFSL